MRITAILLVGIGSSFAQSDRTVSTCTETSLVSALADGGHIVLTCTGSIFLTETITISKDTYLEGSGGSLAISGGADTNGFRLFLVKPGVSFTVQNLSLEDGLVDGGIAEAGQSGDDAFGAAIHNQGGSVTLLSVTLSGHQALGGEGGASGEVTRGTEGRPGGDGGQARGGAIYNEGGLLTLSNVVFHANFAVGGFGGAGGDGLLGGNGGDGGSGGQGGTGAGAAVYNTASGTVMVMDSTFASNRVEGVEGGLGGLGQGGLGFPGADGVGGEARGAAIYNDDGTISVVNSTFELNSARGAAGADGVAGRLNERNGGPGVSGTSALGGGIYNRAGTLAITNCTFFANTLEGGTAGNGGQGNDQGFGGDGGNGGSGGNTLGAGLYNLAGSVFVVSSTFAGGVLIPGESGVGGDGGTGVARSGHPGNAGLSQGNAVFNQSGGLIVKNSILSGTEATSVSSGVTDEGFNLISDNSLVPTARGTQLSINPLLSELADHGGSTPTMALLPGSPAIGAITVDNGVPQTDQRTAPRSAPWDIGAYESDATPVGVTITAARTDEGVILSWPVAIPTFTLEATTTPPNGWEEINGSIAVDRGMNFLTLPTSETRRFFRLTRE